MQEGILEGTLNPTKNSIVGNLNNPTVIYEPGKSAYDIAVDNGFEGIEEEDEILQKGLNVIVETSVYNTKYDKSITIENVYEYLKTLPQFEGTKNI